MTVPKFPCVSPLYVRIKNLLLDAGLAVAPTTTESSPTRRPPTEVIAAGARLAKEHGADVILGLGGGSSMDAAKAIAVEATHPGTASDISSSVKTAHKDSPGRDRDHDFGDRITSDPGRGGHQRGGKNKSAFQFHYPKISIVDPELVRTAPRRCRLD